MAGGLIVLPLLSVTLVLTEQLVRLMPCFRGLPMGGERTSVNRRK